MRWRKCFDNNGRSSSRSSRTTTTVNVRASSSSRSSQIEVPPEGPKEQAKPLDVPEKPDARADDLHGKHATPGEADAKGPQAPAPVTPSVDPPGGSASKSAAKRKTSQAPAPPPASRTPGLGGAKGRVSRLSVKHPDFGGMKKEAPPEIKTYIPPKNETRMSMRGSVRPL